MRKISKIIAALTSIVFIFGVFGCGNPSKNPSQVVSDEIESVKEHNYDNLKGMFHHGIFSMDKKTDWNEVFSKSRSKIDEKFSNLEYNINSEKISGDKAVVNVTVKGPEFDKVWSELVKNAQQDIDSGIITYKSLTDGTIAERYDNIICNLIDKAEISERTLDITLKKTDGEWKVENNDNMIKLITNLHPDSVKSVLNRI